MGPLFLALAATMVLAAAGAVLFGLRRSRRNGASPAETNAAVLSQRLGELVSERDRGLLAPDEFEAARDDLQRRVLIEAAGETPVPDAPRRVRGPLLAVALALPLVAMPLYVILGSPHLLHGQASAHGAGTAATTTSQAVAPPATPGQLEVHVAAAPNDARAWVLLARARMDNGQFATAAVAYQRAVDVAPRVARDATVWCEYADAVGMSQGGVLAGRPRELVARALALDASAPCALEMAGSAAIEARDFRAARDYWRQLLVQLPPESVQRRQLSTALARIERQARFALPASDRSAVPAS